MSILESRENIKLFALSFLILLLSSQLASQETPAETKKIGLAIQTLEGQNASFKDQLKPEKWNVVFVWTTYCEHCLDQYSFLSELHRDQSNNIEVIGICLDEESSMGDINATIREKQHEFPSVIANATDFANAYEINTGEPFTGTPTYLLYYGEEFQAFLDGPTKKNTIIDFIN